MNEKQVERLADASELYRPMLRRVYEGRGAPRQAIKAFCLQCVGYVRKDVAECTALGCPLHPWRPYQAGADDEAEP